MFLEYSGKMIKKKIDKIDRYFNTSKLVLDSKVYRLNRVDEDILEYPGIFISNSELNGNMSFIKESNLKDRFLSRNKFRIGVCTSIVKRINGIYHLAVGGNCTGTLSHYRVLNDSRVDDIDVDTIRETSKLTVKKGFRKHHKPDSVMYLDTIWVLDSIEVHSDIEFDGVEWINLTTYPYDIRQDTVAANYLHLVVATIIASNRSVDDIERLRNADGEFDPNRLDEDNYDSLNVVVNT